MMFGQQQAVCVTAVLEDYNGAEEIPSTEQ